MLKKGNDINMKRINSSDMSKEKELRKEETINGIKRFFIVICYVAVVFNIATPKILWSIPFIITVYMIWTFFSFGKNICVSEYVMLSILKLIIIYMTTVIVISKGWRYAPYVCYVALTVLGFIYHFTESKSKSIIVNIKKLITLIAMTIISVIVTVVQLIISSSSAVFLIICAILSVIMIVGCIFPVREEIKFAVRKYFNLGKDIKDEY